MISAGLITFKKAARIETLLCREIYFNGFVSLYRRFLANLSVEYHFTTQSNNNIYQLTINWYHSSLWKWSPKCIVSTHQIIRNEIPGNKRMILLPGSWNLFYAAFQFILIWRFKRIIFIRSILMSTIIRHSLHFYRLLKEELFFKHITI